MIHIGGLECSHLGSIGLTVALPWLSTAFFELWLHYSHADSLLFAAGTAKFYGGFHHARWTPQIVVLCYQKL